jgi:hypothetical protein
VTIDVSLAASHRFIALAPGESAIAGAIANAHFVRAGNLATHIMERRLNHWTRSRVPGADDVDILDDDVVIVAHVQNVRVHTRHQTRDEKKTGVAPSPRPPALRSGERHVHGHRHTRDQVTK